MGNGNTRMRWRKLCSTRILIYCDDPRHPGGLRKTVAEFGIQQEGRWRPAPGTKATGVHRNGRYSEKLVIAESGNTAHATRSSDRSLDHYKVKLECRECQSRPGATDRGRHEIRSDRFNELDRITGGAVGLFEISFREFLAKRSSMDGAGESKAPPAG